MTKAYKVFLSIPVLTLLLLISVLPIQAFAATSPSLGLAEPYSILSGSTVTNAGATTINGNVGISPGIGPTPHYTGFGTVVFDSGSSVHDADTAAQLAQADKNTAYAALLAQGCDTTYAGIFKELSGLNLVPGVYCADSFRLSSGVLTLNGTSTDVWIFKSASDIVITGGNASRVVFTGGGLACNVWWTAVSSTSFDAGSSLVGNILADTSISFATGASLEGRALARTAGVSLSGNAITAPNCSAPTTGNLTVVKTVINDDNGTNVVSDFNLFVGATAVASGAANAFTAGTYTVSETNLPGYTAGIWGGDCAPNGIVTIASGNNLTCTITNNDNTPVSTGGSSSSSGSRRNTTGPTPESAPGFVLPGLTFPITNDFIAPTSPADSITKLPVTGVDLNIKNIFPLAGGMIVTILLFYYQRRKKSRV
jgi:Ice-binding-like/Prealbumin-like fold domain